MSRRTPVELRPPPIGERPALPMPSDKNKNTLQTLAVQFVSHLTSERSKGQRLDKIVGAFARNQASLLSGLIGGAGVAGGAWAAVSVWSSSLGLWSSLGYAIGWISLPLWIPLVGGAAGLTAAGGAIYGVLHLHKGRQQKYRLRAIIGFSKMLTGRTTLEESDAKVLRRFLQAQDIAEDEIAPLLATTPEEAEALATRHLPIEVRREIARYIFPLVYQAHGVIGAADRRRFRTVCLRLDLGEEAAQDISKAYRQRLEDQWSYMGQLVALLTYFASQLGFDGREMEIVREELQQLLRFDPRRAAEARRQRLLDQLGDSAIIDHATQAASIDEAALIGAYAMAHTASPEREDITTLIDAFSALLARAPFSRDERKKIEQSRREIDALYELTRRQIARISPSGKGT